MPQALFIPITVSAATAVWAIPLAAAWNQFMISTVLGALSFRDENGVEWVAVDD